MNDLKSRIIEAFSSVPYPGDDKLIYGAGGSYDVVDTWHVLRGKSWQELPAREFLHCDTPIPDLSPEGFQYYLPGLLLAGLDESSGVDCDFAVQLSCCLTPSFYSRDHGPRYLRYDARDVLQDRMRRLAASQRAVTADALEEFVRRGHLATADIKEAITALRNSPTN